MRVGTNADQSNDLFMAINGGTVAEIRIYGRALRESEKKTAYMMVRPGSSYVTINNIAANAITTAKLATDSIKSINYSAGVDGSFLDLATGEMKMHDGSTGIVRSLEIGPNGGLLAKDGNGVITHDIPDDNIGTGNFYCGHIIWFKDAVAFKLLDTTSPTTLGWANVVCEDNSMDNIKGGIFKVTIRGESTTQGHNLRNFLMLRPKGETWGTSIDSNSPTHNVESTSLKVDVINNFQTIATMMCPIGDDLSIQYYLNLSPNTNRLLKIHQIGALV